MNLLRTRLLSAQPKGTVSRFAIQRRETVPTRLPTWLDCPTPWSESFCSPTETSGMEIQIPYKPNSHDVTRAASCWICPTRTWIRRPARWIRPTPVWEALGTTHLAPTRTTAPTVSYPNTVSLLMDFTICPSDAATELAIRFPVWLTL